VTLPVYRELLDYNVAGPELRRLKRLLIYGTCVRDLYPDIYNEYSKGRVALSACLEKTHFNMVTLKVASIMARVPLEEIVILTVDGSPHCIQLHMALQEAVKLTKASIICKHVVIENGKPIEVDDKHVKTARYLSKIKRLLDRGPAQQ